MSELFPREKSEGYGACDEAVTLRRLRNAVISPFDYAETRPGLRAVPGLSASAPGLMPLLRTPVRFSDHASVPSRPGR